MKVSEPTVTDICALHYDLEETIQYKLLFDDEWKVLSIRSKKLFEITLSYPQLNKSRIPIKKNPKYNTNIYQNFRMLYQMSVTVFRMVCHIKRLT